MSALGRRIRSTFSLRTLRGQMPDRLFFGPVFDVQMRVSGRQWSTYAIRFVYAALLTFIACLSLFGAWYTMVGTSERATVSSAAQLQQLQTIAPQVATSIGIFQFVALTLIAPLSFGPSLGDERRTGTLSALLTTPLSALQIVCSRLSAQLMFVVVLTFAAAPLLLAMRTFGGVPASVILGITLLCISNAMVGASLSMYFSLSLRRGAAAAASAIVMQGLLWLLPVLVMGALQLRSLPGSPLIILLSPPVGLGLLMAQLQGQNFGMPSSLQNGWLIPVGVNLLITMLTVAVCAKRLRMVLNVAPQTVTSRIASRARKLRKQTPASTEASDTERILREAKSSREVGDHPVLWRELRQGIFGGRYMGLVVYAAMILLLLYLYVRVGPDDDALQMASVTILTFMAMASAGAVPAQSFAAEREARTWDVLCTTPLSAGSIVLCKLVGVCRRLWLFPAVITSHVALSIAMEVLPPSAILLIPATLLPALFFQACSGLWLSSTQNKPSTASMLNLGLSVALWMVLPMLLGITASLLSSIRALAWIEKLEVLGILHPMVMLVSAVHGGIEAAKARTAPYELPGAGSYSLAGFSGFVVAYAAFYLVGGLFFLWLALRRVRILTARER